LDITNRIENYINSQNRKIWDEIKNQYNFRLIYNPSEYSWASKVDGNFAEIVTPNQNIEFDSFTHELLHIYIDYLGLTPYPDLIHNIKSMNSLGILVVEGQLISHLYNVCSHKKMFPIYKEIGFSEYNFVQSRISFNDNDLNYIRTGFLSSGKQSKFIDQLIGHALALMNNFVEEDELKCQNYLDKLKLISPELFEIVNRFDTEWKNAVDLDLLKIFLKFEEELDGWLVS
jgi:hypothetical protein